MGKKTKKTAAKKKNEKKNKERAALARKEAIEQKKAAQATGKATKAPPQKPKAGAVDKKDKQRVKEEKAKEKQRLKDKKEKEKREANQKKRQEKIQELKDLKKKAEQVKKKGKKEPKKTAAKKESKATKEKKTKTEKTEKIKKMKNVKQEKTPVDQKSKENEKNKKDKKQKKADVQNESAKASEAEKEPTPVIIETPIAETGTEAVSAEIVMAEELAETVPVGNDDPRVVPESTKPAEEPPVAEDKTLPTEENIAETAPVGNDPCVVPEHTIPAESAFSIADLVRSALSKPEEITQDADEFAQDNSEIEDEKIEQAQPSDITKNPLAELVHSAIFKPEESVEATVSESDSQTTQIDNATQKKDIVAPSIYKKKTEKPKKDPKPKRAKESKKSKKSSVSDLSNRLTSAIKEKTAQMSYKAKRAFTLAAAGVLLLAVVLIAVQIFGYNPPEKAVPVYRGLTESSVNVRDIEAEPERQLEMVKETKASGKTRAFKVFANNEAMIEEWYDRLPLVLGNVYSNECDFIVTILHKDTIVYRSMGITPGKYLPFIQLFDEMPYGAYELRVVVVAYDPQTYKKIGVQHMKFKLVIGNEQGLQEETEQTQQ